MSEKFKEYVGKIVRESLEDPMVLYELDIINVKPTDDVDPQDRWHIYQVRVSTEDITRLCTCIKAGPWYMHFWKDKGTDLIVVFRDMVFEFDRDIESERDKVIEYGLRLGIPREQLDFTIENMTMYEQILSQLGNAKATGDPETIKKAVLQMIGMIRESLDRPFDYLVFWPLVNDESYIFETTEHVYSKTKADVTIRSSGLLNQVLKAANVPNHQVFVDSLDDTLGELHSSLSRGEKDTQRERDDLLRALLVLEEAILIS